MTDSIFKNIPSKSWEKIVDTATGTLVELVSPIVAATSGLAKLIEYKLDEMNKVQQALAKETLYNAIKKARKARGTKSHLDNDASFKVKSTVVLKSLMFASEESNESIREIWANLIANELIGNDTHPDFPIILASLNHNQAKALDYLYYEYPNKFVWILYLKIKMKMPLASIVHRSKFEADDFTKEHLKKLGLIKVQYNLNCWMISGTGIAFMEAVSDPSLNK